MYALRYNTRAAGSERYALIPVTSDLVLWADQIVFVQKSNYESVAKRFDLSDKDVKVLDIPDHHDHMSHNLMQAFRDQYEEV